MAVLDRGGRVRIYRELGVETRIGAAAIALNPA
jgi:hypothetical protein